VDSSWALYKHHTNVHVSLQFYKDVLELGDMTKLGKATPITSS